MFSYRVSNDMVMKIVSKWCKQNKYNFVFDAEDKEVIYPFKIDAPSNKKSELEEFVVREIERQGGDK